MIEPKHKFFSEGQAYWGSMDNPDTEAYCNVWNWDELRMVKIKATAKLFPPEEDKEIPVLAQFVDCLSPDVRAVSVDNDGLLYDVSTDPEEDDTMYVPYYRFSAILSFANCKTVMRSALQELDRLGPSVDLSTYQDESGKFHKVAFKFNVFNKPLRLRMAWDELHILMSLPLHPNLVPFDRIVLEDVESRVIGFTTKYFASKTLEDTTVPFRFEWLQQLTSLVDFLNLELGIVHQDIAPRNLLLDPDTDKVLLFDFDRAMRSDKDLQDGRDDVSGVVYTLHEIITGDTHVTGIPHWDRSIEMVQSRDWTCHRELDSPVSVFRTFLDAWIVERTAKASARPAGASKQLIWPDAPPPPDYNVPFEIGKLPNGDPYLSTGPRYKRTALKLGQYCVHWQRTPQSRLNQGVNGVQP